MDDNASKWEEWSRSLSLELQGLDEAFDQLSDNQRDQQQVVLTALWQTVTHLQQIDILKGHLRPLTALMLALEGLNEEGRANRAQFLLVDYIIKTNSNSDYILDFEGSNIPSIARFYGGFGANATKYHKFRGGIGLIL